MNKKSIFECMNKNGLCITFNQQPNPAHLKCETPAWVRKYKLSQSTDWQMERCKEKWSIILKHFSIFNVGKHLTTACVILLLGGFTIYQAVYCYIKYLKDESTIIVKNQHIWELKDEYRLVLSICPAAKSGAYNQPKLREYGINDTEGNGGSQGESQ